MDNLFLHKLCTLVKLDVLSLLDLTEHFVFFLQLAKTFGNTNFFSIKYQHSSEFSQIAECRILVWKAFLFHVQINSALH